MSKKKWIAICSAGILIVAVIVGILIWRTNSHKGSVEKAYVDKVSALMELGSGSGSVSRFSGIVQSQQTWEAKADASKTVKKIKVKQGDTVKAGTTLFTYDVTEAKEELSQAKLDLEEAKVQISGLKDELKALKSNKDSAKLDILEKQNEIKQAEYDQKSKEADVKSKQSSVKVKKVKSEIAGIVQKVNNAAVGADSEGSDSGTSDAVVTILSTGNYRVKATMNEQNVEEVEKGKQAIAYSRINRDKRWGGTVSMVDQDGAGTLPSEGDNAQNAVDETGIDETDSETDDTSTSTSYTFYVTLKSSEGLRLGQHVYVEMDYGQASIRKGVWLDASYIKNKKKNPYVWKINKKKQLEKQPVILGEYNKDLYQYEIKKGLSLDDGVAFPQSGYAEGIPCSWN